MTSTSTQTIPVNRPFPLNYLSLSDKVTAVLRLIARSWILLAVLTFGIAAWQVGVPSSPARGDWEVYAQIGLLVVAALGALLALRWEGAGATLIMLAAMGLGALAAAEYTTLRSLLVMAAFFVPSVLFWLVWQRAKPVWEVAMLAVVLVATLAVSGYAANRVYATYFGRVQPDSALVAVPGVLGDWVVVGNVTDRSLVINAALRPDAQDVRLAVSTREDLEQPVYIEPVNNSTSATFDNIVSFSVDGLTPDTTYWYALSANDAIDDARKGTVRTFPQAASSFTFAFGSCLETGSNGAVFDTIRQHDPLFFLVTGDFFYEDIAIDSLPLFRDGYDLNLTSPAQSALYQQAPLVYTWDDHDFGPNNADSTSPSREAAQTAYRQVVPHYDLPDTEGGAIYQAFTVGRVRFIMTDNYSYRSPAADPDGADKTMLGDEQQAWFEQELLDANGRYPVIVWVNSQPWIVDPADNADGWGAYATERQEIANFINDYEIQGLMSLSGDAHMLAIDDGSHNLFGTEQVPGFPVFQAAALDRRGTEKGGPYSEGAYPGGGQFGLMTVNDNGGEEIEIIWSGRNYDDEEIIGYTFTVPATPVQSAEKEPAASAWAPQALAPSPFHSGGRRKRRPS